MFPRCWKDPEVLQMPMVLWHPLYKHSWIQNNTLYVEGTSINVHTCINMMYMYTNYALPTCYWTIQSYVRSSVKLMTKFGRWKIEAFSQSIKCGSFTYTTITISIHVLSFSYIMWRHMCDKQNTGNLLWGNSKIWHW